MLESVFVKVYKLIEVIRVNKEVAVLREDKGRADVGFR
jgi:hypothetical protein